MTDFYALVAPFVAGMVISVFYLGSLWLTARQIPKTDHPHLLIAISFIGRVGITLLAFYLAANNHWQGLLACFLGFFTLRAALMRWQVAKMKVS